jgi:hypothetical protein
VVYLSSSIEPGMVIHAMTTSFRTRFKSLFTNYVLFARQVYDPSFFPHSLIEFSCYFNSRSNKINHKINFLSEQLNNVIL